MSGSRLLSASSRIIYPIGAVQQGPGFGGAAHGRALGCASQKGTAGSGDRDCGGESNRGSDGAGATSVKGGGPMKWRIAPVGKNPLFPLPWMIPDRSFAVKGPLSIASHPGRLRADPKRWLFMREKGGVGPCGRAEREPFGHTRRLEPQPWGAVTRRAVAQRRSRASGLTRPLAAAIRGFDSGFGLGFVVDPLARTAAVCRKSFVFSSLPIRKVLVLPFAGGR